MTIPALAAMPTRCSHGFDPAQAPIHTCRELVDLAKSRGIASANDAAAEDVKDRIDAAIMRRARRGGVFSANDFRDEFPESGPIVGARVSALASKHFEHVGYVASTKASTHGHPIKTWRLRGAA